MHPDDECEFASEILSDDSVQLIDGPRWKTKTPETFRTLSNIGTYCVIWSTSDMPELTARYVETCDDWYCQSEYATIQFLRSELQDSILTEGSIAIATLQDAPCEQSVEARYKTLRRFIKKRYTNSIVQWCNPQAPLAPARPKRSANPSKPDPQVWVGPHALQWLEADTTRRIKQHRSSIVEATVTQKTG
ncbi:MAG: hypothetical protein AAGG48_31450 [Planctomycetota bacterium]